ncbi:MAG: efflux RND transporter periplasmic adaptor subunit [Bryobacteraceae bacterium]|nr:efflux RND transporter periplasmic adaptor subunit [Bryobacteraceae bacterium]
MIRYWLPAFIFVVTLLAVGCTGGKSEVRADAASTAPETLTVQVAEARPREVERSIFVTGSLHPDETVTVSAEVPGRVSKLYFDFGQNVQQGQVVAELDKQELTIGLERSRAALAQALARIGLDPNQAGVTPKDTPAIRQARAQFEEARFRYENARRLVKTGDISQERFTELEKSFSAREAALQASRDELQTQLANVQALRAEVRLAEKRLGDATVRAPFSGTVSERLVAPGQYIKENTPILTIVRTNPLRLRVDVPESAAGSVRPGTTLKFTTDAVPGAEFQAVVREMNPALDPKSRSLTAEARMAGADSRLKPGMFVQVRLVTDRNEAIVTVPKQAIHNVAGLSKVFVIRDGTVIEHKISPGIDFGDWVEIPAGTIQAGEKVAISRLGMLTQGAKVQAEPAQKG